MTTHTFSHVNHHNHPKVSVIIPVYNTEEFVEDAVRSVMNQTLQEIEIIIINDGSTDNSQTILDKLATEDNRISIYKQQNEGLSITRNRGLSLAIGKYVYFMDSDDFLESDALNYCYKRCEEKSLDLICFVQTYLIKKTLIRFTCNIPEKNIQMKIEYIMALIY